MLTGCCAGWGSLTDFVSSGGSSVIGRSWLCGEARAGATLRVLPATGRVLDEEGDRAEAGAGPAGGGGGTSSRVLDEAVGEPGGGAGAVATAPWRCCLCRDESCG